MKNKSDRGLRLRIETLGRCIGVSLLCGAVTIAEAATPVDAGFKDFKSAGSHTTAEKPESKLWRNDGIWWASLWNDAALTYRIHRLNPAIQDWVDTSTAIDDRKNSRADALWDAGSQKLYIVSHLLVEPGVSDPDLVDWGRLYRYSYNTSTDSYSLDSGFPVTVNQAKTESLVLARDSTGRLWVTWVQSSQVRVNYSSDDGLTWATPFVLPVGTSANVSSDDLCSVIDFNGNIGVMWSNQQTQQMYFAVHPDSSAPNQDWQSAVAYEDPGQPAADDHINLKKLEGDPAGRVFAAIKTSHSPKSHTRLLVCRDTATDCTLASDWENHVVWSPIDNNPNSTTRPQLLIDTSNRDLYVFGTKSGTESINYKVSDLDNISFPAGQGVTFINDSSSINDATTTKQNVSGSTGIAVAASSTSFYYHNTLALAAPVPVADFSATPLIGAAPLTVDFTDLSSGSPDSWLWMFGDGGTSSAQDPTHVYNTPGSYNVSLSVSNDSGSDSITRAGYVTVLKSSTTMITGDTPSVIGQAVTVSFTVAGSGGTPTGNVTVTDGTNSCVGPLNGGGAGSCLLTTYTTVGNRTLTATYAGDAAFFGSTSAPVTHTVNKANTMVSITSDNPDPSDTGEVVTVSFTVAVTAPGSGTPTGNVTVNTNGGSPSCTATVAEGSCTLSFSTPGMKTLTATYAGNANFNGSISAGMPHRVTVGAGAGASDCDFNGDLMCDILFRNKVTGANLIWNMNGASRIGPSVATSPASFPVVYETGGVGDFDADGDPDILFRHKTTGAFRIWFMSGATRVGPSVPTTPASFNVIWAIGGVGDFDGDGHADIVFRHKTTGAIRIWFMNGANRVGLSVPTTPATYGLNYEIGGVGDFDLDGDADIVFRNKVNGFNRIWLMDGTTTPTRVGLPVVLPTAGLNWVIGGAPDVDGDGDADILLRNKVTGTNRIWFFNGTTFSSSQATTPASIGVNWEAGN